MKILVRILIIIGSILLALIIGAGIFVYSGSSLPSETEDIINDVITQPVPEFVTGSSGYVISDQVKIWYESRMPADSVKGTILLSMGIANDAMAWPEFFLNPLVDSGYQVIRYDQRGVGMSDWLPDWNKENAYTLDDMANDAITILDSIGIERAHLIGVSMGGMISQQIAILFPYRVISLTSMMSSGYIEDPELPSISRKAIFGSIRLALRYGIKKSEENNIKLNLAARYLLMGDSTYTPNAKEIAQQVLYNVRNRRGYNLRVSPQHLAAVSISGSRYDELKNLPIRSLIVHGTSDPLIHFEHGKKCAEMIPGSETLWVKGMGHDIPERFTGEILTALFDHLQERH